MTFNGYHLEGTVLDARARLLKRSSHESDRNGGQSVTAWFIDRGEIADVCVDGSVVVAICEPPERPVNGSVERTILMQEQASPDVVRWSVDAFHGKLGGPLSGLTAHVSAERGFFQVPIHHLMGSKECRLGVSGRLDISAEGRSIPTEHPAALQRSWKAEWIGEATRLAVDVPEHGMAWSGPGFRVVRGAFLLEFEPPLRSPTQGLGTSKRQLYGNWVTRPDDTPRAEKDVG